MHEYKYIMFRTGYNSMYLNSKSFLIALTSCYAAMCTNKNNVIVVKDKKKKEIMERLVEEITGGAWPIKLKIKTVDELTKPPKE